MQLPIGGPRIWRRLVSGWWQPEARMRREWEARARLDAKGYIGRGYAASEELFGASGESDLNNLILQDIELDAGASSLEIGCGVGRLLRPLAARTREVWGVDIAPTMIELGRQHLAAVPNAHLHVTTGRLEMIPSRSLDFAYSIIVFQHIPTKAAIGTYLAEVARALKGGGIFKFQVDGRSRPFWQGSDSWLGVWYRAKDICAELKVHGFHVVDTWGEGTQYFWLTAVLPDAAPGRPALVKAKARHWNRAALEDLLNRLAHDDPTCGASGIIEGKHSIRDEIGRFLDGAARLPAGVFVREAFLAVLNREPDDQGLAFYSSQLEAGASRAYVMDCLLASAELRAAVTTLTVV